MGRKTERYMGGALYIALNEVVRILGVGNLRETIEFLKQQGVWPTAVRNLTGDSPATCIQERPQWWVEHQEVKNLALRLGRSWPPAKRK